MSKSVRIDDDILERITNELPGKTLSDKLRGLMTRPATTEPANGLQSATLNRIEDKVDQLLELGISVPEVYPPASIPGVQVGARPRRETGTERTQREAREREDRARSLDSIDDDSIDRSAEYVSQA